MKRFLLLSLSLMLLAGRLSAQNADRIMLKLRLSDNAPLSVFLDGRHINKGTASLTLDGLRPGFHRIEVYNEGTRRPIRVFTGNIRLRRGMAYYGIVDVYNHGLRLSKRPVDDRYAYNNDGRGNSDYREERREDYPDRDNPDYNGNRGGNRNGADDEVYNDRNSNAPAGSDGFGSFPRGRNGGPATAPVGNSFSSQDMSDLQSRVAARITDSDKKGLMQTSIEGRTVSTEQVRRMMGWLSFDDTKLELAKWAYDYTADKQNYWKLEDAFSFSATKEAFNKSIRSR